MKIEHVPDVPALRRDWLAARIVGALGVVLILAAVVFSAIALWSTPPAARDAASPAVSPAQLAQARQAEGAALCNSALAAAQKIGVVPGFATRTSGDTSPAPQGRYICTAKTDASAYAIVFDLACPKTGGNCVVLPYAVTQDGTSVYQRK